MKHLTAQRPTFLLGIAIFITACGGSGSSAEPTAADPLLLDVSASGTTSINPNLWDLSNTLAFEALSDTELAALAFMREEEKLAGDVYLDMHDLWGTPIFVNIADSEQTHTDVVLRLIEKYSLADPAEGKPRGEFSDATLQGLYDSLTAQGSASLIDALIVGATIEDLDIFDLHQQLSLVDNQDITVVFENLQKGSRNHLRAFYARLTDMNIVYSPLYISQACHW